MEVNELANAFPMLTGEAFTELKEDIEKHGLVRRIVLDHKGKIVDGRNRWKACQEIGWSLEESNLERLPAGTDLRHYIWSTNGARRHLTVDEKIAAFRTLWPKAKRGGQPKEGAQTATVDKVAEETGASKRSVQNYDLVTDNCPPEIQDAVSSGLVSSADALAVANCPVPSQLKWLEEKRAGLASSLKAAMNWADADLHQEIREFVDTQGGTKRADAIKLSGLSNRVQAQSLELVQEGKFERLADAAASLAEPAKEADPEELTAEEADQEAAEITNEQLVEENENLKQRIKAVEDEGGMVNDTVDNLQKQNATLRQQLEDKTNALAVAEKKLSSLSKKHNELFEKYEDVGAKYDDLYAEHNKLLGRNEELERHAEELQQRLDNAEKELRRRSQDGSGGDVIAPM